MTKNEFWEFMNKAWEKDRVPPLSMFTSGTGDPRLEQRGAYIGGIGSEPRLLADDLGFDNVNARLDR